MIPHLFRLIWNKKKTHALLIVEIWASFMVLFGLMSLIVFNVRNYREPLGFTYQNVWAIGLQNNQDTTEIAQKANAILQRLKGYSDVASVSRASNNYPFSSSTMSNGVEYEKRHAQVDFYTTDGNFANTLEMPVVAGRWYRAADSIGKFKPVVLNQKASEELFGTGNPLGKIISKTWKVIGVVKDFHFSSLRDNISPVFIVLGQDWGKMSVRVNTANLTNTISRIKDKWSAIAPNLRISYSFMDQDFDATYHAEQQIGQIFIVFTSLAIIIACLGLFGLAAYAAEQRTKEIGIR
ncbi:MAG: macrolide ABC transporter permease, partial [Cytophagaceae bacterium]